MNGTALSTAFTADAIYSWDTDVYPLFGAEGCTAAGCHDVIETSGLRLDGGAAAAYAELVSVTPVCDAFTPNPNPVFRISPLGGVSAADVNSLVMLFIDGPLDGIPAGDTAACNLDFMTFADAGNVSIVRAWIRNGAPEN